MKDEKIQIEAKFDKFRSDTESCIKSIEFMIKEPRLTKLFAWLLTTDISPYSFLPYGWQGSLSTASETESLFSTIYGAVVDDGDISFVTVGGEPRIVFGDVRFMTEDNINDIVLSPSEKFPVVKKEIKILNIEPNEFVDYGNEFATKQLQKHFVTDAAIRGLDCAVNDHSKNRLFSESWSTTLKQRIDELVKRRSNLSNTALTQN